MDLKRAQNGVAGSGVICIKPLGARYFPASLGRAEQRSISHLLEHEELELTAACFHGCEPICRRRCCVQIVDLARKQPSRDTDSYLGASTSVRLRSTNVVGWPIFGPCISFDLPTTGSFKRCDLCHSSILQGVP